mmetsp:Transcript_102847/g.294885  ORF Transcript_102847/g.294885 Transcript_102847/m.294885 type:complete len:267 (-) Transcript_102847:572-1372(-)
MAIPRPTCSVMADSAVYECMRVQLRLRGGRVGGRGKADLLVLVVEDGVVLPHEDVAKDPVDALRVKVHAEHEEDADRAVRQHQVVRIDAADRDIDRRKVRVAAHHVLARRADLVRAEGGRDVGNGGGRADEHRGARVDDRLAGVSGGEVGAVDSERVNLDLPVRGRGQRNVVELTDVVVGVSATEGELARVAVHALGEARLEAAKVERKLALVDESVGDHAAEGRRHAVHHVRVVAHGDFVERQSEDAVEFADDKGHTHARCVGDL